MASRNVTAEPVDPAERFSIYRLCDCTRCAGKGKAPDVPYESSWGTMTMTAKCPACRGEGRTRDLVATCATPEALGVAIVTLGREGEFSDGCPVGILDSLGETGQKWLVTPWSPSARNVSDAGRTLAQHGRKHGTR